MTRTLFASVVACALAAGSASAQTQVSVRAGQTAAPVTPVLPFSAAPGGATFVAPLGSLGLTPTLSAPSLTPSMIARPAALAAMPSVVAAAVSPVAVRPVAAISAAKSLALEAKASPLALGHVASPALSVLSAAAVADQKSPADGAKLDAMFDGSASRSGESSAVAAPAAKPVRSFLGRAALAAGVFIAHPAVTLAAQAPAVVEPGAMAIIGSYAPLATAIAAVLGALFGLWSTRSRDGSPANAGSVFAAALSHGAIAGAAAFTLIDLTKVAFLGASAAALTPLTAAVATAALAQTAFAAKFMDPATTPAERVMGAFPAVAMAFGLSVGAVAFLPAATMLTIGTAALMLTGAATALYTAVFRLEKSPAGGPAAMGRGFVLQALMTGLALALGPSPYALFFFALGMAGFGLVMLATVKELWAAVPQSLKDRLKRKP
ncbi:MAG: hypothetical protein Q8T11_14860 [Elusimicrobiota bacterium]|nr:hypothetical protein [Elusimicrobiota bacterium]